MKKLYLSLAMASALFGMQAKVEVPRDLYPDFSSMIIPDGWVTRGVDAKMPNSFEYKSFFPNYSADNAFSIHGLGLNSIAFTPNKFTAVEESDQWLISEEFEFTEDSEVVCVTSCHYASTGSNYRILLSEGGTAAEDFTTELTKGRLVKSNQLTTAIKRIVVEGMKGKKARLAMVATGKDGMSGFYDIEVAPYYMNIINSSSYEIVKVDEGEDAKLHISANVMLPVEAKGIKAVLETSGGYKVETENTKTFRKGKLANMNISFADPIPMEGNSESYTVTITPNYDGALSTVISGRFVRTEYESAVLLEEATSTGCGFCPYGYALLNFYQDKYNTEDNQRVIGLAYHALYGKKDPMYVEPLYMEFDRMAVRNGFEGYPWVMVNRSSGCHPADLKIENLLEEKTYGDIHIKYASYDKETNKVKVVYNAELGYDTDDVVVNAVALFSQNKMSGVTNVWSQSNYLGQQGVTEANIASMFGEDAIPYFSLFVGKDAPSNVPAKDMVYDDIARACYPSFTGETLDGAWKKNEMREFSMELDLPETVTDWQNTDVVVVLTNNVDSSMVNADRAPLTDAAAVENVTDGAGLSMSCNGDEIVVNAASSGVLTLFAADGRTLATHGLDEGMNRISLAGFNGVVIAKAVAGGTSKTVKVIVR